MGDLRKRSEADWLYLQARLTDLSAVPDLLQGPVRDVSNQPGVQRWFHLQYFDQAGPSLRVRMQVDEAKRDQVRSQLSTRLRAAPKVLAAQERAYAPEQDKFGNGADLDRAHDVFCAASAIAVRNRPQQVPRPILAAAIQVALTAHLGPSRARRFLYHYAWYWSGRGVLGPLWQQTVRTLAVGPSGSALHEAAGRLLTTTPIGRDVSRFGERLCDSIGGRSSAARPAAFLLHTHLHLFANRLGIFPAEEAQSARTLSLA